MRLNFDDGAFVRAGQVIAVLRQAEQNAAAERGQCPRPRGAAAASAGRRRSRIAASPPAPATTPRSPPRPRRARRRSRSQAQIGDRVIRAPFAGWVSLRNISVGAIASQGTEIATVSDLSTIKLDFTVPETMLAAIREGLPIEARSAAYPDRPFNGTIRTIDPVIDPNTRAVTVRAHLPNPDRVLRPGMMMSVAIQSSSRTALSVPELAVLGEGDSRYVFVVGAGNRVHRMRGADRRASQRPRRDRRRSPARPAGGDRGHHQGHRRHGGAAPGAGPAGRRAGSRPGAAASGCSFPTFR